MGCRVSGLCRKSRCRPGGPKTSPPGDVWAEKPAWLRPSRAGFRPDLDHASLTFTTHMHIVFRNLCVPSQSPNRGRKMVLQHFIMRHLRRNDPVGIEAGASGRLLE